MEIRGGAIWTVHLVGPTDFGWATFENILPFIFRRVWVIPRICESCQTVLLGFRCSPRIFDCPDVQSLPTYPHSDFLPCPNLFLQISIISYELSIHLTDFHPFTLLSDFQSCPAYPCSDSLSMDLHNLVRVFEATHKANFQSSNSYNDFLDQIQDFKSKISK